MRVRHLYLLLCVIGTLLPYSQFVPWVIDHGFDAALFVDRLFSSRISSFFALDVIVSALVLLTFILSEGRRAAIKHLWAPIVATLLVGVSLGLPLFLYLRERKFEHANLTRATQPRNAN